MSNQRQQQSRTTGGNPGQVNTMEVYNDPAVVHIAPVPSTPAAPNPTVRVIAPVPQMMVPQRMVVQAQPSVQVPVPTQMIQMQAPPPSHADAAVNRPIMQASPAVQPAFNVPLPTQQVQAMVQGPPHQPAMDFPGHIQQQTSSAQQIVQPAQQPMLSQHIMPPPTTLPAHFFSHSEGFITSPVHMTVPQHQSLPLLSGSRKRVIIPDENGIDHPHPVSDVTLHQVRTLIEAAEMNAAIMEANTTAVQQHLSLGSLPSASSNFSSISSLGSATSQGYNAPMPTSDPMMALQEYCNMLMRTGQILELHHFKQFLDVKLAAPQTGLNPYSGEVSQCQEEQELLHEQEVNDETENTVTSQNDVYKSGSTHDALTETSSETIHESVFIRKPKKGVLTKLNSVVSRLLAAWL